MKMICYDCAAWCQLSTNYGMCKKNPPSGELSVLPKRSAEDHNVNETFPHMWPVTESRDYCMAFSERESPKPRIHWVVDLILGGVEGAEVEK